MIVRQCYPEEKGFWNYVVVVTSELITESDYKNVKVI